MLVIGTSCLTRIEIELLHLRRQRDVGAGREQQRVAVRRGGRDLAGAERAAGARAVLDHEGLAELGGQMLRAEPRHHVGVAAGAERHDDGHRPGRPVRGVKRPGERREDGDDRQRERQTQRTMHVIPHSWQAMPFCADASRPTERRALPIGWQVRGQRRRAARKHIDIIILFVAMAGAAE